MQHRSKSARAAPWPPSAHRLTRNIRWAPEGDLSCPTAACKDRTEPNASALSHSNITVTDGPDGLVLKIVRSIEGSSTATHRRSRGNAITTAYAWLTPWTASLTPSWIAFAPRSTKPTASGSRASSCSARARGDARPDSDYDIAVFIEGLTSVGAEAGRIAAIGTDILLDTGAVINALPFAAGADDARTGFMGEVRRDGRDL